MKIITDGNPEGFFDQLQLEQVLSDHDQREAARLAEIEFLEQQETHAEFCAAMKAKNGFLAESPDLPLDEASYRDFKIRRQAGEGK